MTKAMKSPGKSDDLNQYKKTSKKIDKKLVENYR